MIRKFVLRYWDFNYYYHFHHCFLILFLSCKTFPLVCIFTVDDFPQHLITSVPKIFAWELLLLHWETTSKSYHLIDFVFCLFLPWKMRSSQHRIRKKKTFKINRCSLQFHQDIFISTVNILVFFLARCLLNRNVRGLVLEFLCWVWGNFNLKSQEIWTLKYSDIDR